MNVSEEGLVLHESWYALWMNGIPSDEGHSVFERRCDDLWSVGILRCCCRQRACLSWRSGNRLGRHGYLVHSQSHNRHDCDEGVDEDEQYPLILNNSPKFGEEHRLGIGIRLGGGGLRSGVLHVEPGSDKDDECAWNNEKAEGSI